MFMIFSHLYTKRRGMRKHLARSGYIDEKTRGYGNNRAISPRVSGRKHLKESRLEVGESGDEKKDVKSVLSG